MTILKQEIRQGRNSLIIWAGVIAFMMGICVLIYPEMESQMAEISGMFSEMGSFSAAFGMDQINFGEFLGFFSVECGNILGLGGAFFAALLGISALAKEEKEHTAEFLLTHPVSRKKTVLEKLSAIVLQIVLLNLFVIGITVLAILMTGEKPDAGKLMLLFSAYFILQLEVAAICFGLSAFISRGGLGIGLGIAALLYFLNIIANLTESAGFLKYITPFGYTEGSDIIVNGRLELPYLFSGVLFLAAGMIAAFYKYDKKDIF